MRIVTRPDFDGAICAVLLRDVLDITEPVKWIEPYEMKKGKGEIGEGDVIANLPYASGCSLWFDHHLSNRMDMEFEGAFKAAPSAAGIIFNYYEGKFSGDYKELVLETDRIDSADLTIDEVHYPERFPYMLLASTISGRDKEDEDYWNRVVELLGSYPINQVMEDLQVRARSAVVIEENRLYSSDLKKYTEVHQHIGITDFRSLAVEPKGNRFLIYSLFPEILVDVKIRFDRKNRERIVLSMGQNIFNQGNKVALGELAAQYGGGGHPGVGACSFPVTEAENSINQILEVLKAQ